MPWAGQGACHSLNSEFVKVKPSKSVWLSERTISASTGVKVGFSDMKSESKLLKSLLERCKSGREGGSKSVSE